MRLNLQMIRLRIVFIILFFGSLIVVAQDILKIKSPKGVIKCPMTGKVSLRHSETRRLEYEERNSQKNRYNIPTKKDFDYSITLKKMLGEVNKDSRTRFSESKAAQIEGWVVFAPKSGSGETCNCHTKLAKYTDRHIEIAESMSEKKGGRTVIVELTPRLRIIKEKEWAGINFNDLLGHKIRVSGWLFYDKEHEPQACNVHPTKCKKYTTKRQSCWEIHPITDITILQ